MTILKKLTDFIFSSEQKNNHPKKGAPVMLGLDIETTGLIAKEEVILSMAVILIDSDLKVIGKGFEVIVNQPKSRMDQMDEWCTKQHGESGLTEKVLNSPYSLQDAEKMIIDYVHAESEKIGFTYDPLPMMGNSLYLDRSFVELHAKELFKLFHFRNIDVSSIKELTRFMRPDIFYSLDKEFGHTALNDIIESLEELRIYRDNFLKASENDFSITQYLART